MTKLQLIYRPVKLPAAKTEKLKAIKILMNSGHSFTAISDLEYMVSLRQCKALTAAKINYIKQE